MAFDTAASQQEVHYFQVTMAVFKIMVMLNVRTKDAHCTIQIQKTTINELLVIMKHCYKKSIPVLNVTSSHECTRR
jgi:hypothetical protein